MRLEHLLSGAKSAWCHRPSGSVAVPATDDVTIGQTDVENTGQRRRYIPIIPIQKILQTLLFKYSIIPADETVSPPRNDSAAAMLRQKPGEKMHSLLAQLVRALH